jgi:hypothetical protein
MTVRMVESRVKPRRFHARVCGRARRREGRSQEIGAKRTIPGGIDALVVSYYKLVFPTLKPSTRADRCNILERFLAVHGKKPVARLEYQHVATQAVRYKVAELGCGEREIMSVTDHKSMSEVARYTKTARQGLLAEQAMEKLSAGRTRICPTPAGLDKTAAKRLI